jgi:hypothetical protein
MPCADVQALHAPALLPATPQGLLLAVRGTWQVHSSASPDARALAEGHGLWWHAMPHAWHIQPQSDGAQLLWVALTDGRKA